MTDLPTEDPIVLARLYWKLNHAYFATIAPSVAQGADIAVDNGEQEKLPVCPVCAKEFRPRGRNRKRRHYCSDQCRYRAWAKVHRKPIKRRKKVARRAA